MLLAIHYAEVTRRWRCCWLTGPTRWLVIAVAVSSPLAVATEDVTVVAAERAVAALESTGKSTPELVASLLELGRLYRERGEPVRALAVLENAVKHSESAYGPEHPDTAIAADRLGVCALAQGDWKTARTQHKRALAIREKELGPEHATTARSLNNLGLTLLECREAGKAVELFRRALKINEKVFGADDRATAVSLMNLGRAELAGGNVEEAITTFSRAQAIRTAAIGADDPVTAVAQTALAGALMANDMPRDAEELLDVSWALVRKKLGEQHPATMDALDLLVRASREADSQDTVLPREKQPARLLRRFYVRDSLGIDWQDQLVTFPFHASRGECMPGSVWLQGPDGTVPVQLVDVTKWPDGSVQSGKACFWVNLAAFQCSCYTLRFEKPGDRSPQGLPSRLSIDTSDTRVTVRGTYLGAEFDITEMGSATPAEHSGPLVAMLAPDGARFGGSEFFGKRDIQEIQATIVEAGPVLATLQWRYKCQGGLGYDLRATLGERDTAIHWEMQVTGDAAEDGWRIWLNSPGDTLAYAFQKKAFSAFEHDPAVRAARELDWVRVALHAGGKSPALVPWYQQYFDNHQTVVLLESSQFGRTQFAMVCDPGAWVVPQWPRRFGTAYPGRLAKGMQIAAGDDDRVSISAHCGTSVGGGVRKWTVGLVPPNRLEQLQRMKAETKDIPASMALGKWLEPRVCDLLDSRRLDRVKDYVLHWPRRHNHPSLFVTKDDVREARERKVPLPGPYQSPQFATFDGFVEHLVKTHDGPWYEPWHHDAFAAVAFLRGDRTAAEMRIRDRTVHHLGLLGQIDRMRDAGIVAALYDATIDTEVMSSVDRRILDGWMAYLCYVYADPNVVSYERGYHPGPPNITIAYVLSLGICACAIPDHPMARTWVAAVMEKVRYWLDEELGDNGEWIEGAHYDNVTLAQFIAFAIAMKNAGFEDLTSDPRLRLFAECVSQHDTPADPLRQGRRVTTPIGRRVAGTSWAMPGLMAATARSDDSFSAHMQWAWKAGDYAYRFPDDRLGGMEMLLLNPSLTVEKPKWESRWYRQSDVLFRNDVASNDESYFLIPSHWCESLAPRQVGSVAKWFAHGSPLGGAFSDGDADRHQLLGCQVVPACSPTDAESWSKNGGFYTKGEVKTVTMQPMADYLDASFITPFVPFQGGSESPLAGPPIPSAMPKWPAIQEAGQGPMEWRRQVLFVKSTSEKSPSYVVLRDSVKTNTPTTWLFWTLTKGLAPAESPRLNLGATTRNVTLLHGDHFAASGQFGVDLEYIVATPRDTPRNTLRWGKQQTNPPPPVGEYQDLLHLQMAGQGSYFVVLFPKLPGRRSPTFKLEGPDVITLSGEWGSDLVFLSDATLRWDHDNVQIDSASGLIRRESEVEVICLANGGRCQTQLATVTARGAVTKSARVP